MGPHELAPFTTWDGSLDGSSAGVCEVYHGCMIRKTTAAMYDLVRSFLVDGVERRLDRPEYLAAKNPPIGRTLRFMLAFGQQLRLFYGDGELSIRYQNHHVYSLSRRLNPAYWM